MIRSAVVAIHIAFWEGVVACLAQVWVIRENWKNLQAVKTTSENGNLRLIVRWAVWVSPLVLGLFLFMTFLAFIGIQSGPPVVATTFGTVLRWSYVIIMAVCLAWSVGDLIVRRRLT